jgi:hypothetical protein
MPNGGLLRQVKKRRRDRKDFELLDRPVLVAHFASAGDGTKDLSAPWKVVTRKRSLFSEADSKKEL